VVLCLYGGSRECPQAKTVHNLQGRYGHKVQRVIMMSDYAKVNKLWLLLRYLHNFTNSECWLVMILERSNRGSSSRWVPTLFALRVDVVDQNKK